VTTEGTIEPTDLEAARAARAAATDDNHTEGVGVSPPIQQPTDTELREIVIRDMHAEVQLELDVLRNQRSRINDRVRVLVNEERRLARMVHIIDKAREDGDDADQADSE
jgi:hypothetical protein